MDARSTDDLPPLSSAVDDLDLRRAQRRCVAAGVFRAGGTLLIRALSGRPGGAAADPSPTGPGVESTALAAPRTQMTVHPRQGRFHERANRVVIRHHLGDVVCAIEVVSPGNKAGKFAAREFVAKATDLLKRGINVLIVDPFPPGSNDPQTRHRLIWDEFDEGVPFELPADEPLLLASCRAAVPLAEFAPEAYIEPLRAGAELPDMPAWLNADLYVNVPLEQTYMAAWNVCPSDFRNFVEHGSPV
ncbi:MAG TPA: hypothetical protein VKU82_12090 [Planctomycetaceae bacterium]|nr:hypothetical protein [Planctomycetaceae bacterium]